MTKLMIVFAVLGLVLGVAPVLEDHSGSALRLFGAIGFAEGGAGSE